MASGKPLSPRERKFIEDNRHEKFPSVIARHLTMFYAEDNNGSRCTETVKIYIKKVKDAEAKEAEQKAKPPARAPRAKARVN